MYDAGLNVRREVLGDEYVDQALTDLSEETMEFQHFITKYCWGEVWTDTRLQRRERSLIVLAITAALGRSDEFEIHLRGAVQNGLTKDELLSLIKQVTIYCGVPAGVESIKKFKNQFK